MIDPKIVTHSTGNIGGGFMENLAGDIYLEVIRAENKFPEWPDDPIYATALIAEESGEAVKAAVDLAYGRGQAERLRKELLHTAAMCVRALAWLPNKPIVEEANKDDLHI